MINFAPGMGAPERVKLNSLTLWTSSKNSSIKYFSVAATYTKTFEADKRWFAADRKTVLDLGKVGDVAEVSLNGK